MSIAPDDLPGMMPLMRTLGIEVVEAEAGEVVGTMAWDAGRCTIGGVLHGGAVMSLADTVGAVCAFLNLPEGATTSTIESKSNFFRAVTDGDVKAVARPLHVGRTTIAVRTEVTDDHDRLVAHVVQTQAVLGTGPSPL